MVLVPVDTGECLEEAVPTRKEQPHEQGVEGLACAVPLGFEASRGGDDLGGEQQDVSAKADPFRKVHIFGNRQRFVEGTDDRKKFPRQQEPLVAKDAAVSPQPGLPFTEVVTEPQHFSGGVEPEGKTACHPAMAVYDSRLREDRETLPERSGVGKLRVRVQKKQPFAPRGSGPGIHLPASAPRPGQHNETARKCILKRVCGHQRSISGAAVAEDHLEGDTFLPGESLEEGSHGCDFIEDRDDDGESWGHGIPGCPISDVPDIRNPAGSSALSPSEPERSGCRSWSISGWSGPGDSGSPGYRYWPATGGLFFNNL